MGTNRRWDTPYDAMKELIHGGRYGKLLSITIHQGYGLFNMSSHAFDLFLWLNNDQPVDWVQFHLTSGGDDLAGGRLLRDPNGGGRLQFANGVAAFASDTGPPLRGGGGVRAGGDQLPRRGRRVRAARGWRGELPRPPHPAPRHLSALHPAAAPPPT